MDATQLKPDEVQDIGNGGGIFRVGSRSHQDSHTVNVCAFDGIGTCECHHFYWRNEKPLRAGERDEKLRCHHIRLVHAFIVELFTAGAAKRQRMKR